MQAQVPHSTSTSTRVGVELLNLNRVSSKPQASHCGYCDGNRSCSWGFTKQVMHPYTYQLLAEKGWRRCGTYYYKPDIKKSCCKLWTHRMDVNGFKIKKDQKKTVKSVVQWLMRKMDPGFKKASQKSAIQKKQLSMKPQMKNQQDKSQKMQSQKNMKAENNKNKTKMPEEVPQKWIKISEEAAKLILKSIQQKKQQFFSLFVNSLISQDKYLQFQYKIDLSKVKCFISKPTEDCDWYSNHLMLLFGTNKKLFKKQYSNVDFVKDVKNWIQTNLNSYKIAHFQVERSGYLFFNEFNSQKLARKQARERERIQNQNKHKQKLEKNSSIPNKDTKQIPKQQPKNAQQKKHLNQAMEQQNLSFQLEISSTEMSFGPLTIYIVPAQVTTQSWRMYQRYCQQIHEKPEKSQSSYSGFLCEKALQFISEQSAQQKSHKQYSTSWDKQNQKNTLGSEIKGKKTKLLGCYHMKYYIQKQLIGVGVVDLLPHGLSSVYFFYEPKYKDLRLGVFSSLIEIEYVRWVSLTFPQYKYYYMGFYIQNSQKMNYKGNYQPFDLLCPITYQFVECTAELRQLIDKIQKKQVQSIQLAKNNNKIADMTFQTDLGVYVNQKTKIKYNGMNLSLRQLNPKILIPVLGMLRDMAQVWGKQIFEIFTFTF